MNFIFAIIAINLISETICDNAVELTNENFNAKMFNYEVALVMFHTEWCGHCKILKPKFENAAAELMAGLPAVQLAKVDCAGNGRDICERFNIRGYPTLKIFKEGRYEKDYDGPRDMSGMIRYMKKYAGPGYERISSEEELKQFLEEPKVGVVGYLEGDSALRDAFMYTVRLLRDSVRFGLTELRGTRGVVIHRPRQLHSRFEPAQLQYEGTNSKFELEGWVRVSRHGLLGHRDKTNLAEFKTPLVIAYFKIDYLRDPKGTNYWRNRILKVAQNFSDHFNFAMSSTDEFRQELSEFLPDLPRSDKPIIFARNFDNSKYIMEEAFTMENLERFLTELQAGRLEPMVKSEPVPEGSPGPVVTAVAKNFDEVVTRNGQDTFLEMYAPWCGHCKKLAPVWEELGRALQDEDVTVAQMNAAENDVPPHLDLTGFPTLYWLPKDSKLIPTVYEGSRTLTDFIKFIAKHSTSELKGYDRNGVPKKKVKEEL